MVISFVLDQEV